MMPTILDEALQPAAAPTGRGVPRLGFVGVGWIGYSRMQAILESGAGQAACILEPASELAGRAAQIAPQASMVADLDELLRQELDGVVIATPSALHAAQSIEVLRAGLPVFCQKPLARSGEETAKVLEAAEQADRLLGVDLSYRYITAARKVRDVIAAGHLGEVYAVDLVFHNAYGPDKPWFYDARLSGGGCVIDLGIHLVDFMLWNLGFPKVQRVTSRLFSGGQPIYRRDQTVEDYALARMDLESGATANLACSWKLHAGQEAVISARFYGTRAGVCFHNLNGSFYDFGAEWMNGTKRQTLHADAEQWSGRAAVDWARQLAISGRFNADARKILPVAEALDAIYQNADPARMAP